MGTPGATYPPAITRRPQHEPWFGTTTKNTETFWEEPPTKTGPIRVFGELIPDRIFARAAEQLLRESKRHGDPPDCGQYILECAAHHVRYPDSTQSFQSVAWMEWGMIPDTAYKTLKALYDEAVVARSAAEDTPNWGYLERRCAKLAREIDAHVRGRVNALAEAN